jgi:hypothetical protein
MSIIDEDHKDGDEDMIVGGIGFDPDSDVDAEHDEDHGDVNEIGIVIDSDMIVVGIGSDSGSDGDSGVDAEYDEFFGDVDVIHSDSDLVVVGIGSDSDSDGDSEHNEDVIELPSAHNCEVLDNFDELPFCVSQTGERGDMHEEAEKRDVVDNTNLEGEHNDEKTVETQEHKKSEKRDGTSSSSITYHTRQSSTKT